MVVARHEERKKQPQNVASAAYYSAPVEQGAAIFRGTIKNHLFIDGNHRTAIAAYRSFAKKTGMKVNLTDNPMMDVAKQVSRGLLSEVSAIGTALSK